MKVTVSTPIYNRGNFIPSIYENLCCQTYSDIEWIVVDDGSTDDTKNIMINITNNNNHSFPITYLYKLNGGKHSAINMGVQHAQGELFFILDSDDSLPTDAIATVVQNFKDVSKVHDICGVCGLMAHHDGSIIGNGFPSNNITASSIELRYKYGVTGDLMEVFKTSVLRKYPFPEIENERFCPEALVWNRIALKYRLKCFNHVICYRDYLTGGLTDNIIKVRMKSPVASTMYYAELNNLSIPLLQKTKAAINYWRFRLCLNYKSKAKTIGRLWVLVLPFSITLHILDIIKAK